MSPIIRPSLKEIEARIFEFEALDISTETIEDIKSKLKPLMTGYVVSTPYFNQGVAIYRGVRYNQKPNFFLQLIYPPANQVRIGRANREGIPVFYCTTDKYVPFYELNIKAGERLVISEWIVEKRLLVNHVGYTKSVFDNLNSIRPVPDFSTGHESSSSLQNSENYLVQNFLAKTFSQKISDEDSHLYKLTNAIVEKHFSEDDSIYYEQFKGIMYPTIRMEANADNLAISKLAIDHGFLKFEKVEFIEMLEVTDNSSKFKIVDVAFNISNGEIQWKNLTTNWEWTSNDDLFIIENANEVLAYDSNGELINPIQNNA